MGQRDKNRAHSMEKTRQTMRNKGSEKLHNHTFHGYSSSRKEEAEGDIHSSRGGSYLWGRMKDEISQLEHSLPRWQPRDGEMENSAATSRGKQGSISTSQTALFPNPGVVGGAG